MGEGTLQVTGPKLLRRNFKFTRFSKVWPLTKIKFLVINKIYVHTWDYMLCMFEAEKFSEVKITAGFLQLLLFCFALLCVGALWGGIDPLWD